MLHAININSPIKQSAMDTLREKAILYKKTGPNYKDRTDAILNTIERLESLARGRGYKVFRQDAVPVSRRAVKSTKYKMFLRIGTGDVVPTIQFRDSLNGESCTFIDFGLYRKVCSNGLHIATSEELVFKQNHLNDWKLDDMQIVALFERAIQLADATVQRYTNIQLPDSVTNVVSMRNALIERIATNGLITPNQSEVAKRYPMAYYDKRGDVFGVLNAVQESLTTNRNGLKKETDANARLNRQLIPAIEQAMLELYNIAA